MAENRPRGREKNVTSGGNGVHKRGDGLGTGPVGSGRGGSSGGSGGPTRQNRSGGSMGIIMAIIIFLLGGGGGAALLGGGDDSSSQTQQTSSGYTSTQTPGNTGSSSGSSSNSGYSQYFNQGNTTSYTADSSLDTTVAKGTRDKYTTIKGNGKDQTTIMVYMCGTDLESKSGMATSDMQEMIAASFDDHINILVYTGGCKSWRNNVVSSSTNQIYKVENGGLKRVEADLGSKCMTDTATLTSFIKYCNKNYPANRNDLIFWDHGGGTVSGYGYDEKYASKGGMTLAGINKALSDANLKFDFIGFDACLMATTENALMLTKYADYLIASEETEPGVGWYYTDWLTAYGKDPSRSTVQIGKDIIDSFVKTCATKCQGQKTTLSIVDLAELENTLPEKLTAFSKETVEMIQNDDYQELAAARGATREFAQSNKIDQIDLIDLANNLNTKASKELIKVLDSAIKYNRTSTNMTKAYGLSIYFPSRRLGYVDSAVSNYEAIGMNEEYTEAIKAYASLSASGQVTATSAGNTGSAMGSLFGESLSGTQSGDLISALLGSMLTQGSGSVDQELLGSLGSIGMNFLSGKSLDPDRAASYITDNQFDASALTWSKTANGENCISLSAEQWALVTDLNMSMYYDDGEGYVDLGLDNLFAIDDDGNMIADTDKTWLSINGQPVAYYHTSTTEDGDDYCISGYVPAMLNGERVKLLLNFDNENPYGYIAGAETDYHDGETLTSAKAMGELEEGDTLEFLCDYYSYDGIYQDTYYLGEPMTVTSDMEISNTNVGDGAVNIMYCFTDIYGNQYWSEVMP